LTALLPSDQQRGLKHETISDRTLLVFDPPGWLFFAAQMQAKMLALHSRSFLSKTLA
jgi:hypothetical protein